MTQRGCTYKFLQFAAMLILTFGFIVGAYMDDPSFTGPFWTFFFTYFEYIIFIFIIFIVIYIILLVYFSDSKYDL